MFQRNSEMILKTILNEPHDKDAKRAYADALIEEGNDIRGNFIMESLGKKSGVWAVSFRDEEEANLLLPKLGLTKALLRPLRVYDASVVLEDGFITHLATAHNYFLKYAKSFFKSQPILSVRLVDRYPNTEDAALTAPLLNSGSERYDISWELRTLALGHYAIRTILCRAFFEDFFPTNGIMCDERCYVKTVPEALQLASVVAVRYGRKRAGLKDLTLEDYTKLRFRDNGFGDGYLIPCFSLRE